MSFNESKSWTKVFILFCVIFIVTSILIFLSEVISFFTLKFVEPKHVNGKTLTEFIIDNPKAFDGVDDFNEVKSYWLGNSGCPNNRFVQTPERNYPAYDKKDVSCNGIEDLTGGLRLTTDKPLNPKFNIYVFGGSTVFGTGATDRNTIPSHLQRIVNKKSGLYTVWNRGISTVVIAQELEMLKDTKIVPGDIVVFYDGGNDIWQGVVNNQPNGTIIGYNDSNRLRIIINTAKFYLSKNSYTYRLLGYLMNGDSKKDQCGLALNPEQINERASAGFSLYKENILKAKYYVENSGGKFYHFLQPTLLSKSNNSDYENQLIEASQDDQKCVYGIIKDGSRYFREGYIQSPRSFSGHDLTQILNSANTEFFIDWIHATSNANVIVAKEIYNTISESIK